MGSPRTERLSKRLSYILLALGAALVFLSAFQLQKKDTDIFWALKSGEWIFSNGRVPAADPFSYTFGGSEWIDFTWGFQVLAHSFFGAFGGWPGLFILQLILTGAAFCLIFLNAGLVGRRRLWLSASVVFIVLSASYTRLFIRPHLFAYLFIAAYFYILNIYEERERPGLIYLLYPLQALWVNAHSSAILGVFVLGAYAAGAVIDELRGMGLRGALFVSRKTIRLVAVSVTVPLAMLVNPYGLKLAVFPFIHQGGANADALRHIGEWTRIPFEELFFYFSPDPVNFFAFRCILVLLLVSLYLNRRLLRSRDLIILAGSVYMAVSHVRWVTLFAYFAAPMVAYNIGSFLESRSLERRAGGWSPEGRLKTAFILLSFFLAFFVVSEYVKTGRDGDYGIGLKKGIFPEGTVAFIKENGIEGNIYNEYVFGGYLIHNGIPVFIDGRTPTVYSPYFYWTSRLAGEDSSWKRLVDEHGIDMVLVKSTNPLCTKTRGRDGWKAVSFDDVSVLFLKEDAFGELARDWGLEVVNPCSDKPRYELPEGREALLEAREELEAYIARWPRASGYATTYQLLGLVDTELGGEYLVDAASSLEKAASIDPAPAILYDHGLALGKLGRQKEAIRLFTKVIARDERFKDAWLARGVARYDLKEYPGAISDIDEYTLLADDTSKLAAYKTRGMACFHTSRFGCALESLKRAAFISKDRPELASLYYYIGNTLFETGELDEGVEYYARAIETEEEYRTVLADVASSLEKKGRVERAARLRKLLSPAQDAGTAPDAR